MTQQRGAAEAVFPEQREILRTHAAEGIDAGTYLPPCRLPQLSLNADA